MMLPPLPSREEIAGRLSVIFPEGTTNRGYVTRDIAVKVVFVALYSGAIEGADRWIGPKHVYTMTDEYALKTSDADRLTYSANAWKRHASVVGKPWYKADTRESIRDETLREGLQRFGAVIVRTGIPPTSSKPRYALAQDFAALFAPTLTGTDLEQEILRWPAAHLSGEALARIAMLRHGAVLSKDKVDVTFPNGSMRQLAPGTSSVISKEVIETFAPRFMREPVVLFLSESGNKVVEQEKTLAAKLGLNIDAATLLPDIILWDFARTLLLFVEVVATDGPMTEPRREALMQLAKPTGLAPEQIAFMTAYADRNSSAFRKNVASLAWDSFVWFMAEPAHILVMRRGAAVETKALFELLG